MTPKYCINDIIIIQENGVKKKRHIFGIQISEEGILYNVDYNLGLSSEGTIKESNILCISDETHKHIAL